MNETQKQQRLWQDAEWLAKLGIWEWDVENDIAYWSIGLFNIFKRPPCEGAPKWAAQSGFYQKECYERLGKAVEQCAKDGTPYEVTVQAIRSDGELRTCISRGRAERDAKGKIIRLWGTFQDVTEQIKTEQARRDSEDKFRSIFEKGLAAVLVADDQGNYIGVNKAAEKMFGYSQAEFLKMNVADLNIKIEPNATERYQKYLEEGEESGEFEFTNKAGEARVAMYSATRIRADFNLSMLFDITDRKTAEKDLKRSNATKDKIFSIIGHDLRSPFTGIIGLMDVLRHTKDFTEAEIEDYLSLIQSSAESTLGLLENLLNWARTQTGKIEYNPEKVDLLRIIQEVLNALQPTAYKKKIILEFTGAAEAKIIADRNMIETVLRNLVANAIKYTNTGGKVKVGTSLDEQYTVVSIADNGIGMDEETRRNLFRFELNQSTRGTANEKGTGLGLILCQDFVHKHGGRIWVESSPGKGSTFKFTIPRR